MRIAAVAFIRGLVLRRVELRRSPLFVHCQRRYRWQDHEAGAAARPPDPEDAEDAARG